jgi:hypothetical protein
MKTWNKERIMDSDMNRMEQGIAGRVYVVDPTGTKGDFTTVQAAIDKCEADGGGTVYCLAGQYNIAAKITIQGNYIALEACGDAIFKKVNNLNDDILEIGTAGFVATHIRIEGIIFDGNRANQGATNEDVEIIRGAYVKILKCGFREAKKDAIKTHASYAQSNIMIKDNWFSGIEERPLNIQGTASSAEIQVFNNKMDNFKKAGMYAYFGGGTGRNVYFCENVLYCSAQTSEYGVYVNAEDVTVALNTVDNSFGEGIWVAGSFKIEVLGNNIYQPGTDGIKTSGMTGVVKGNRIFGGGANGILLEGGNIYINVCDNTIVDVQYHGIYLKLNVTWPTMCQIVGNLIAECSQALNNTYSAIKCDTVITYCGIHGNHAVASYANKMKYAVDENGSKNHVDGNSSHGAVTAGFNVAGIGSQSNGNTTTV